MYSSGGWNTMPGSCNSGFRSRPSGAGGISRANGFEVKSRNSRKPTLIKPIIDSTRAASASGRLREKADTAQLQPVSISAHSNSDPSCEPQVAAMRECSGNAEFELEATERTEKSVDANDQ